jgi:hypothetical protein
MRNESSAAALSWIPSEAITGADRAVFDAGFTRYATGHRHEDAVQE